MASESKENFQHKYSEFCVFYGNFGGKKTVYSVILSTIINLTRIISLSQETSVFTYQGWVNLITHWQGTTFFILNLD